MRTQRRSGFTLVELLVVIAIIIALVTVAVLLSPNTEKRHTTDAADQLQTYLASARSRALRDNVLTGVRLLPDANGNFTSFQLIQAPEPYAPTVVTLSMTTGSNIISFTQGGTPFPMATMIGGVLTPLYVNIGDLLELSGKGDVRRVTGIGLSSVQVTTPFPEAQFSNYQLPETPTPPGGTPINSGFRFIREPRALMGEQALQIPNNVAVLANGANGSLNIPGSFQVNPSTNQPWNDIIFSPSGQVTNASSGRIVLWVQSTIGGPGTLLCIYTRTGGIASHPIGPAGSEYTFTQDGRSSGQ